MDRKDQIKAQVQEAIELLPDVANAVKAFDPVSTVSHFPSAAALGVAGIASYISKKFGKGNKIKPQPPLGKPEVKRKGIPGIISIGDPRQRS